MWNTNAMSIPKAPKPMNTKINPIANLAIVAKISIIKTTLTRNKPSNKKCTINPGIVKSIITIDNHSN